MADYMKVYADNAATTSVSETAIAAMVANMREFYGNPSSLHAHGQDAAEALAEARATIAKHINAANPREIIFTSGGSEADNQALFSAAHYGAKKGKKHIISSRFEHHAILHTLDELKKQGFEITLLEVYSDGLVRIEDVKAALREDTAIVSVMMVNNEIGTVQPTSEIGALCRERGVLFHCDAVQSVGHMPVDVQAMNIDMLSLSGHKFHAPKGVGAFYVRSGVPLYNLIHGGAQERGLRAGTENMPGIIAMAAALTESVENMEKNTEHSIKLRDRLIEGLSEIPQARLNGDRQKRAPGTVNFCFEGIEGESLLLMLNRRGISASSGSACTSGSLDPSHVLMSLGLPHEVAHGSLRLSVDEYNTAEEVEHMIVSVKAVVERLREMSPLWDDLVSGKKPYFFK